MTSELWQFVFVCATFCVLLFCVNTVNITTSAYRNMCQLAFCNVLLQLLNFNFKNDNYNKKNKKIML